MAVSKRAEKERLQKERISKVGKELLVEEMKKPSLQERITAATMPYQDGDKWYKSKDIGKPRSQIAKEIIRYDNKSLKGGNAAERMENDSPKSFGKNDIPRSKLSQLGLMLTGRGPIPELSSKERPYYPKGKLGDMKFEAESIRRGEVNRNYNVAGTELRNKWENPMYGLSEKDKQKMMKKKGKK